MNASDRDTPDGRALDRERRMALSVAVSVVARVASVLSIAITVPLLFRYLGEANFSAWILITASLSWVSLARLGIGSSLLSLLAPLRKMADDESTTKLIATAFVSQAVIAVSLVLLLLMSYPILPWRALLGVDARLEAFELRTAATLLWISACASLPASIALSTFRARQEGYIASFWECAKTVCTLALLIVAVTVDAGLVGLSVAYAFSSILFTIAACYHAWYLKSRNFSIDFVV
jgi:O-antigen/teichoic acid export membrane protein